MERPLLLLLPSGGSSPAPTGYAPMDVIWLLAMLLCVLGSLPLDCLMLGMAR